MFPEFGDSHKDRILWCVNCMNFSYFLKYLPLRIICILAFSIGDNKSQGFQTAFDSTEVRTSRESRFPEGDSWAGEEKPADAERAAEEGRRWPQEGV